MSDALITDGERWMADGRDAASDKVRVRVTRDPDVACGR